MLLFPIVIILTIGNTLQPDPLDAKYAPSTFGVPNIIAGHEVLAILTSDNTRCMPSKTKRIILRTTIRGVDNFFREINATAVHEEINNLGFSQELIGIQYVGLGITKEQYLANNENWNRIFQSSPCEQLVGVDLQELSTSVSDRGFNVVENLSVGASNNNAQSVVLVAPSWGGYQPIGSSAFMNNATTDTNYFLQNGFFFPNQIYFLLS